MSEKIISVFGSSQPLEGSPGYEEARLMGRLLAQAGFTVMNGGYYGTMEAVSRGVKEGGGRVIGVTVEIFNRRANPWLDEEIRMPTMIPRLERLTTACDGCIALQGGIGTLTEVSLTWTLLQVGVIPPRPFLLLGEYWRRILDVLAHEAYIKERDFALLRVVETPQKAVEELRRALLK